VNAATPERWDRLWQSAGLKADAHPYYDELQSLYGLAGRHYHDLRHISDCLTEFDATRHLAHQTIAVEFAIWFHDAIYDTHASDNEERSADLAKRNLSDAGVTPVLGQQVGTLILATKNHDSTLHKDAALLVDIDLSILGQPQARFFDYEAQIRREYEWVPGPVFCAKRAEILERFIARPRIYTHQEFYGRYEQQARMNLEESVRRLGSGRLPD
jgi:predicted metal-dependent HD superfamily phosphohydrolase